MNWQNLWSEMLSLQPGIGEICLRLACAMLVGLVIGTEREYTHRPAGMRTHILVALGACVISVTGELIFSHYSTLGATPDPARLSAQVVTGVGFLGAGTIMREGPTVKGLTTAASLWAVACLGLAAGFGYYAVAIFGMVFIFVTLTIFEWLQKMLMKPTNSKNADYILETMDISATLTLIHEQAAAEGANILNILAKTTSEGHTVTFRAEFTTGHRKARRQRFFNALATAPETRSLHHSEEEVHSKL